MSYRRWFAPTSIWRMLACWDQSSWTSILLPCQVLLNRDSALASASCALLRSQNRCTTASSRQPAHTTIISYCLEYRLIERCDSKASAMLQAEPEDDLLDRCEQTVTASAWGGSYVSHFYRISFPALVGIVRHSVICANHFGRILCIKGWSWLRHKPIVLPAA